jgi:translation initiation factor 2 subunit 1
MLYRREGFPEEDEFVLCTVTKVLNNAVFVNLDEYDKGGLVHISEIAPGRIRNIRDYVELSKKIVCKILRLDKERGHIDLSLRRVSDMERKKKLEEIKQEQKAEKVIEIVAQQLKKKPEEIYDSITSKVFERYPFVHQFFKDIAIGSVHAKDLIADEKVAQALEAIVQERFKPQKITIRGAFAIKCFAPDGVEVIRQTLVQARKKGKKTVTVALVYVGGGRYKMSIEAENYKEAEQTLGSITQFVEQEIVSHDGEAQFAREEA